MKEVSIDLYEPTNDKIPRYSIQILDQKPSRENGRYAAFIVPQGRETEWLFATEPGRKKLLLSAKYALEEWKLIDLFLFNTNFLPLLDLIA